VKKILVIDDDHDFRAIVKEVLSAEGFATNEAADGLSAIKEFRFCQPDVVILDHHMPLMMGTETLREIKKINPGVPVIMVSATKDTAIEAEAYRDGAFGFISKPPEFKDIVTAVKKALNTSGL